MFIYIYPSIDFSICRFHVPFDNNSPIVKSDRDEICLLIVTCQLRRACHWKFITANKFAHGICSWQYNICHFIHFQPQSPTASRQLHNSPCHNKQMRVMLNLLNVITHLFHNVNGSLVKHICVGNLTIIGLDNGLSPGRRQAIIWTNDRILLIGPLGTNFSEILIGIQTFSFTKLHLKTSSAKWRLFCLGLNELTWSLFRKHSHDISHNAPVRMWYELYVV